MEFECENNALGNGIVTIIVQLNVGVNFHLSLDEKP